MSVSAIIRCHQDERILRCIDDLKQCEGNHEIVAVLTETSDRLRSVLNGTAVTTALAPVGNLSKSTNIGIEASKHDRVVILDSDLRCSEGYLDIVDNALEQHPLVKTAIRFEHRKFLERLVAEYRDYIHSLDLFYCPGAAFHKSLKDQIGGHYFNDAVWWTEDAEMNFRVKKTGLPIHREQSAILTHDAESMLYDLKGAYKIGRGKFSQVLHANRDTYEENIGSTLQRVVTGESLSRFIDLAKKKSFPTALYSILWQGMYYLGYYRERIRGENSAQLGSPENTIK